MLSVVGLLVVSNTRQIVSELQFDYFSIYLHLQRRSIFYKFLSAALARKIWDYAWLGGIILYQTLLFILPTRAVLDNDLPLASSMIVLMEQVNILIVIINHIVKRLTFNRLFLIIFL